jgi:hypothetical protein
MAAYYREELDAKGCGAPNCTHDHGVLFLHARCHPGAAPEVCYVKATGQVEVNCSKCHATIASIKVASQRSEAYG